MKLQFIPQTLPWLCGWFSSSVGVNLRVTLTLTASVQNEVFPLIVPIELMKQTGRVSFHPWFQGTSHEDMNPPWSKLANLYHWSSLMFLPIPQPSDSWTWLRTGDGPSWEVCCDLCCCCIRGRWHNTPWLDRFINSASERGGLPYSFCILEVKRKPVWLGVEALCLLNLKIKESATCLDKSKNYWHDSTDLPLI